MVPERLGMVRLVPVPNNEPPVASLYHFKVPAEAVADKTAVPVPQIEAGVVAVMVGTGFTVATTAVLVAVVQLLLVAST